MGQTFANHWAQFQKPLAHRDLWIKIALRAVGSITGPEERDVRVVHELFTLNSAFGTLLQHRDLHGFAD